MNNQIIDFYEIYDYYTIPFWQTMWFKIVVAIAVILIASALFFVLRRKKSITAWDWAEQELDKLATHTLSHKDDVKAFYFKLTHIIKEYFVRCYGWKILDKTDTEFTAFLENEQFDTTIIATIKKITSGAQSVKFANVDALRSQAEEDLNDVRLIIEKTKRPHNNTKFT